MTRLAIRMPKMSMTMTEGEVSEWMVNVGDEVAEGDVVCEVMTDKVDMEVESSVSGTLVEIVVPSGTVEVGEPIGWVEGEDTGGGFGDLSPRQNPHPSLRLPPSRRSRSRRRRAPYCPRSRLRLRPLPLRALLRRPDPWRRSPGRAAWPPSVASTSPQ